MPSQAYSYAALEGQYILHQTLGTGGFAKVKLATHLATGEKVAIKMMNKKALGEDLPRIKLEMEALKELSHQNICKLFQIIETESRIFLVMEYCPGGELFDYIIQKERLIEDEARLLFRQIVAAVAYMHRKGYSHRDLKPNGIEQHLQTCCGSPAYAAPELISGINYNGSKVDVWSMGVLLYALLCGFLPFDDENVTKLYRKIQSGKYSRPMWLSSQSKAVLSEMLQVDPEKRISIEALLSNPWVIHGSNIPVQWQSDYADETYDDACLKELAIFHGRGMKSLENLLNQNKFDYLTASYLLLLSKKNQGKPIRLFGPTTSILRESKQCNRSLAKEFNNNTPSIISSLDSLDDLDLLSFGSPKRRNTLVDKASPYAVHKQVNNVLDDDKENLPSPAVHKQVNKVIDNDKENFAFPRVPTPKKSKKVRAKTPPEITVPLPLGLSNSQEFEVIKTPVQAFCSTPLKGEKRELPTRAKSFESPLNGEESLVTPSKKTTAWENLSAKKVFGSIEKGIDRMRNMLTPNKRCGNNTPRKVKQTLCNVSATNDKVSPDEVLEALQNALQLKGIFCKQKGYTLRGKVRDGVGRILLKFELEVCRLSKHRQAVGVRRKRLEGDTWHYKRVCEEVLKVALLANHGG